MPKTETVTKTLPPIRFETLERLTQTADRLTRQDTPQPAQPRSFWQRMAA